MFRRDEPAQEVAPPVSPPRREKPPAHLSKFFEPSTFATRKAQAERDNAVLSQRRLVGLGASEFTQRDLRTGALQGYDVELYYDMDHPRDRFAQFPNERGLTPLQDDSGVGDDVTPLPGKVGGPRGRFNQRSALRDPSPEDPPPQPV